jgi:hypothetical protein
MLVTFANELIPDIMMKMTMLPNKLNKQSFSSIPNTNYILPIKSTQPNKSVTMMKKNKSSLSSP